MQRGGDPPSKVEAGSIWGRCSLSLLQRHEKVACGICGTGMRVPERERIVVGEGERCSGNRQHTV